MLYGTGYAAPPLPDAGQISRELQRPIAAPATGGTTSLNIENSTPRTKSDSKILLYVRSIRVHGSSVFSAAELEALVSDLLGAKHSLREIQVGIDRISNHYRSHGYLLARAYLPAQDVHDDTLVVEVLEGRLGQQRTQNQSSLPNAQIAPYLADFKPGLVLKEDLIDRSLLLLSDIPGVGAAHAILQPGTQVGTSDMLIDLAPSPAYLASADLDNYGNRYTGEYRAGTSLTLNSPLGRGDQFNGHVLTSGAGLVYYHLAYQVPAGSQGLTIGATLANTSYQLGQDFAALQANGTASDNSIQIAYPFVRSTLRNLSGTLTLERKALVDRTGTPQSESDKQVMESTFALAGNYRDTLGQGGTTSADLALSLGNLTMDDASAALDAAPTSAQSQGTFHKLAYRLHRLQGFGPDNNLSLAWQGQLADKNLASSEKFALGGPSGVRAYPPGEGSGDQGWLASLEWRHRLSGTLQSTVFYDAGTVSINSYPFIAGSNSRSIAGLGMGLNWTSGRLQFSTALALPTEGGAPTSDPSGAAGNPRLWALLSYAL